MLSVYSGSVTFLAFQVCHLSKTNTHMSRGKVTKRSSRKRDRERYRDRDRQMRRYRERHRGVVQREVHSAVQG